MRVQEAVGLGVLVAMRSMTLPAIISDYLSEHPAQVNDNLFVNLLTTREIALLTKGMMVGELIFDKLPFTPDRIETLPLLGRVFVAASLAAILSQPGKRISSAILAAISAVVASYILYHIRKRAVNTFRLSAINAGLSEDASVIVGALFWRDLFHWEDMADKVTAIDPIPGPQ
jgi:uncharacterized membrane protein